MGPPARPLTREFADVLLTVRDAARQNPEGFTTDHVWPLLRKEPSNPNVIGAAFQEANHRGWIEGTERFVKSKRPNAKGRRVQVWKLIE